ncbi:MAG: hypothetical protein R3B47_04840 [Bacteroidia bacterium]
MAPTIITGGRKCMPKGNFQLRPGRIDVEVLEPIPTEGLTLDDVGSLKDQLYAILEKAIREKDPFFQK